MHSSSHICIVGGSGFIGTKLTEFLLSRGDVVTVIDVTAPRMTHKNLSFILHDCSTAALPAEKILGATAIINLAGVSIGRRWSSLYRKKIYDSRILTTRALVEAVSVVKTPPRVFIQASAVGIYGDRGSMVLKETDMPGSDFLAHVCVDWEKEAILAREYVERVVVIRTANVLGPGGLLASLKPIFKKGLGGYFGSGKQYMPWIHWKDIIGIYIHALDSSIVGIFNTSAGPAITQKELFTAYAHSVSTRFLWRIPYFVTYLLFGAFARVLVSSQRIDSKKLVGVGYTYTHTDISQALLDI
jgi:uncharacterized protein (TIGR01777 family)